MIFYSLAFALLFCALVLALRFTKTAGQQQIVFLLANAVFYGYWDWRFLFLLAGVILVCYFCALAYEKKERNVFVVLPVLFCLGILGVCKYLNFFIGSFCAAFGIPDVGALGIILPLGISFYLFQAMSYLLDVRKKSIPAEKNLVRLAVYISFFPQITSGPIVKAHDFLPQLDRLHRVGKENLFAGAQQFLLGLTKKIVFADRIGIAVDAVFKAPALYDGISVLWAVIGYTLQIWFDFSGYSDMAIGIAKTLDFDLGKNFDLPYLAGNLSDFWRRWHISLSTWFRDYVYIPLGGSRKGSFRTYCNLFVTMLLSGLWHGANWTFLLWGAFHGIGSAVQRWFSGLFRGKDRRKNPVARVFFTLFTLVFVMAGWVLFRSASLAQAGAVFAGLFRAEGLRYLNVFTVVSFVAVLGIHLYGAIRHHGHAPELRLDLNTWRGQFLFFLWIFLIVTFMYVGDSAFIYAQF